MPEASFDTPLLAEKPPLAPVASSHVTYLPRDEIENDIGKNEYEWQKQTSSRNSRPSYQTPQHHPFGHLSLSHQTHEQPLHEQPLHVRSRSDSRPRRLHAKNARMDESRVGHVTDTYTESTPTYHRPTADGTFHRDASTSGDVRKTRLARELSAASTLTSIPMQSAADLERKLELYATHFGPLPHDDSPRGRGRLRGTYGARKFDVQDPNDLSPAFKNSRSLFETMTGARRDLDTRATNDDSHRKF